jgi:hypothetical protein
VNPETNRAKERKTNMHMPAEPKKKKGGRYKWKEGYDKRHMENKTPCMPENAGTINMKTAWNDL